MKPGARVHLVGIGGIGLSSIAQILLARGCRVSGSDPAPGLMGDLLRQQGAQIFAGHRAENVAPDTDLLIITSAVGADNPEVQAARVRGIRVEKRRDFLGELTKGKRTIAVAGSHGKTTTTALVGLMLAGAGLDPEVVVGGLVPQWGSNARTGRGDYFVIEADEYDNAFLGLHPYVAVITNVDYDHPDIFPTRPEYQDAFARFAAQIQPGGALVACAEDAGAMQVAARVSARVIRYGGGAANEWRAFDVRPNERGGSDSQVEHEGQIVGQVSLRIPGRHNVLNALAALAACEFVGTSLEAAICAAEEYGGAGRRFEIKGEFGGVSVIDDYAHHPSEIRATLAAARVRFPGRPIWAVFQPHTYSRTRALLDEFARAFDLADHVVVTEIYAAREHDTLGLSGRDIVERISHPDAQFISTLDEATDYLAGRLAPGDVLITLGAGDVNRVGQRLADIRNA